MKFAILGVLVEALAMASCGSSSSPVSPSAVSTMTGTWVGAAGDSSGSMMGAGLSAAMMADTTWTITQTGGTFSGTMSFAGYTGGAMTITGTLSGRTGTFTIAMPVHQMMMGACAATATGTLDLDDMMTVMHAVYTGTNTCTGRFTDGKLSLHR